MQKLIIGGIIILLFLVGGLYFNQKKEAEVTAGGVNIANEYHSTSMAATTTSNYAFSYRNGALGSIIINVLGTGSATFYDATTTDVNKRTNQTATSSLNVLAYIGASQAAGTYVYDTVFFNGLLGVFSGSQGTSTVSHR